MESVVPVGGRLLEEKGGPSGKKRLDHFFWSLSRLLSKDKSRVAICHLGPSIQALYTTARSETFSALPWKFDEEFDTVRTHRLIDRPSDSMLPLSEISCGTCALT
jgi:hypothetical protein